MQWTVRTGAARRADVLKVAVTIGLSVVLGYAGLAAIGLSTVIDFWVCGSQPCPRIGTVLLVAGLTGVAAGGLGLVAAFLYVRRPGNGRLSLPAMQVLLLALVVLAAFSSLGPSIVEVAGLLGATVVIATALEQPRLLKAALLAQAADLGMFGFVWQGGQGEANPLGRLLMNALAGPDPDVERFWATAVPAGLVLVSAKLALVAFLIWAAPRLDRYRRAVLTVALLAGLIGATVSVVTRVPG